MDFGLHRASIQSTFVPVQTKVHFRFRKPVEEREYGGDFPIQGGLSKQIWKRNSWLSLDSNSNSKQNVLFVYVPNIICIRLENANEIWYAGNCGFGGEILAQPSPVSGVVF